MIWDILGEKLTAAGLGKFDDGTDEGDMFILDMPAETRKGIGLYAPLDGIKINPHLPGFYKPDIKVIVRDVNVQAGIARANAVMKALTIDKEELYEANDQHGRIMLKIFYPSKLPIQYPRQDGNTIEWSLNFTTAFTILE